MDYILITQNHLHLKSKRCQRTSKKVLTSRQVDGSECTELASPCCTTCHRSGNRRVSTIRIRIIIVVIGGRCNAIAHRGHASKRFAEGFHERCIVGCIVLAQRQRVLQRTLRFRPLPSAAKVPLLRGIWAADLLEPRVGYDGAVGLDGVHHGHVRVQHEQHGVLQVAPLMQRAVEVLAVLGSLSTEANTTTSLTTLASQFYKHNEIDIAQHIQN
jgi:hypothetical protein